MKNFVWAVLMVLGVAMSANAQTTAGPTSKLEWDIADATVTQAQNSGYKAYINANPALALTGVTCFANAPVSAVSCSAQIPALSQGSYSVSVTRTAIINGTSIESPKSNIVNFQMVLIQAPVLRVVPNDVP